MALRAIKPYHAKWTLAAAALGGSYLGFTTHARAGGPQGLDPKNFHSFEVANIDEYNHNSKIYTIKVPGQGKLPVSSFILTKAPGVLGKDGKEAVRPYTPINANVDGSLRLLIKSYPDGVMSKHFASLKKGDKIEIQGPLQKLEYKPNEKKEIVLVAGGTGVTPMLQVIEEVLSNPQDKTQVTLIFANVSEKDILLKERLDILKAAHPNFHVYYILDKPTAAWRGLSGFVNKDLLAKLLPPPSLGDDIRVYVCGPPGFYKAISGEKNMKDFSQGELTGALKELGYKESQVFKF